MFELQWLIYFSPYPCFGAYKLSLSVCCCSNRIPQAGPLINNRRWLVLGFYRMGHLRMQCQHLWLQSRGAKWEGQEGVTERGKSGKFMSFLGNPLPRSHRECVPGCRALLASSNVPTVNFIIVATLNLSLRGDLSTAPPELQKALAIYQKSHSHGHWCELAFTIEPLVAVTAFGFFLVSSQNVNLERKKTLTIYVFSTILLNFLELHELKMITNHFFWNLT